MESMWVREYLRELVEAAFPISKSKQKLNSLQSTIADHLFKLYFFPSSRDSNHWRSELSGWAKTLVLHNNVKPKNRKAYTKEMLTTVLWDEPFGTEHDLRLNAKLQDLPLSADTVISQKKDFEKFVASYIDAIDKQTIWKDPR